MSNLKIDISDLLGQPIGRSETAKIFEKIPSLDPDNIKNESEIAGKIIFTKIENGIIGDFDLKTKIQLSCARCLKKFSMPINLKFEQEFSFTGAKNLNPDIQYTIEKNVLDIMPAIQGEILLAIPMKPLCNKNCKIIKIKS